MNLQVQVRSLCAVGVAMLAAAALFAVQRPAYPAEKKAFEFEGKQWMADSDSTVAVEEFEGRPVLHVRGGALSFVHLPDVSCGDGTIEVDMAGGPRGVPGIGFHGSEDGQRVNRVVFSWFHPGSSTPEGSLEQVVVTRREGTNFLLRMGRYPTATEWFHARLVIRGNKVEVYVNDVKEPVLVVDKMLDGIGPGSVGVCGLHDCYFANFRCTPAN